MKKGNLILTVFSITLLAMVTGCGGRGERAEAVTGAAEQQEVQVVAERDIVGTWRIENTVYEMTFLEDGTFTQFGVQNGTYLIEGNNIRLGVGLGIARQYINGTIEFINRDRVRTRFFGETGYMIRQ